jgi:hypothetical protein
VPPYILVSIKHPYHKKKKKGSHYSIKEIHSPQFFF